MYSISEHGGFIRDRLRMDTYIQALRQTVTPGSVVVDIGTGSGVHALLACQLGARKVYAIEPDDVILMAKDIAAANGYGDQIEFIQDLSTEVTLPEQADVIVSDLHGVLPWFQFHLPSIADARRRFLAPGGKMIPESDTMWGGIVQAAELYSEYVEPWQHQVHGLDMQLFLKTSTNAWGRGRVNKEQFLTQQQSWAFLDYITVEESNINADITWTVTHAGTGHGCMLWFDTTVTDGVYLTSAPYAPEISYGSAFFPWSEPVSLAVGDRVSMNMSGHLINGDYIWGWHTQVIDGNQESKIKASFKQSTFFNQIFSPKQFRPLATSYVPQLNESGQIDKMILELMSGDLTLNDIAHKISTCFPTNFHQEKDALERVRKLSAQYS